jgi:hypothetical protein
MKRHDKRLDFRGNKKKAEEGEKYCKQHGSLLWAYLTLRGDRKIMGRV